MYARITFLSFTQNQLFTFVSYDEKKGGCLTKNSVKSRQKQRKNGKNYRFGEFLVRTDPGANGFRAEIVVLRPEGVVTYVEREETAIE